MISSMLNMFRVADLRKRILFTLLMILLYRIGAFMPAPGIDVEQVQLLRDRANQVVFWRFSSCSRVAPSPRSPCSPSASCPT